MSAAGISAGVSLHADAAAMANVSVGTRSALRFRLSCEGARAVNHATLFVATTTTRAVEQARSPLIMPGREHVLHLAFLPELPGRHTLSGFLVVNHMDLTSSYFSLSTVPLVVASVETAAATPVAMVGDEWRPIAFLAASAEELEKWKASVEGRPPSVVAAVAPVAAVAAVPAVAVPMDPHRSLFNECLQKKHNDRAWCASAALVFSRKADEAEQRFFEEHRPRGMIQVKARLDNEAWVRRVFHADEDLYIGKLFETITPAAIVAKTNALRAARQLPLLDKRFKQDPATSTVTFVKIFGWAAQVLGLPLPELYVRHDVPGGLIAVPSTPPASVAGQSMLSGFTPQELAFIVGNHLAYYRGEHYVRMLFPTPGELEIVLFAAIRLVVSDFAVPPSMSQVVDATATELAKYVQPINRDALRLVAHKFIERGAKANLKKWSDMVDVTACRAGLLLSADLETAKKVLVLSSQAPGDLSASDKMKELLTFSVSEPYSALRKALGIAVS